MPREQQFCWLESAWSHRPRMRSELRSLYLQCNKTRIVVLSGLFYLMAMWLAQHFLPFFEFDWSFYFLKALGVMCVSLAGFALWIFLVPPLITVSRKGIFQQTGSSVTCVTPELISKVRLDMSDQQHPALEIHLQNSHIRRIGISNRLSFAEMQDSLNRWFPRQTGAITRPA